MDLSGLGKLLLVLAGVLAMLGLLLALGASIVLSVLLTIGLNLFFRR